MTKKKKRKIHKRIFLQKLLGDHTQWCYRVFPDSGVYMVNQSLWGVESEFATCKGSILTLILAH